MSRFTHNHCLGFKTTNEPIDRAFRPTSFVCKLTYRDADLPALERDCLAVDVVRRWLPTRSGDQPKPRVEAIRVFPEKGMVKRLPLHGNEAAHRIIQIPTSAAHPRQSRWISLPVKRITL